MRILTLDFETQAIGPRPQSWPPEPVGVALLPEGGQPEYLAWGHPTGNNCTGDDAVRRIVTLLSQHDSLLCHNTPFDVAVMEERLGIIWRKRIDDTLVLSFMADPYAPSLSLKPMAERHLGMPPTERDAVRDWLIDHGVVRKSATKQWGAHIADAPGDLVGTYAIGDVVRTRALYDKLRPMVPTDAYDREMRMARLTINMEQAGVLVDEARLGADTERFERLLAVMHDWLRDALDAPGLVLTENDALAAALERKYGIALPRTTTGKLKTDKLTIAEYVPDSQVKAALRWEGAASYNLQTYMRPFMAQARACKGRVHSQWNAVRGANERQGGGGARTGRLSSSPNMQNLKDAAGEQRLLAALNDLYPCEWALPSIRSYIVPPVGQVIIGRDYSQIELRIAAHYEDDVIAARYRDEPLMDLHQWVVDTVWERFGVRLERRIAKNIGFGILYGAGAGAIALQAAIPYEEARTLRGVYLDALPSLRTLMNSVQDRGRNGGRIVTLGGREYGAEPPRVIDGERRTFEYKLLNYLIQGSAADLMKEAMLDADYNGLDLRLSVHDELVCYAPADDWRRHMDWLAKSMDENALVKRIDVPVLSQGYMGTNWATTEDVA